MNIGQDLRSSYERLVELERTLTVQRNGLVHHEAVSKVNECSSSMHYDYASLVEKYSGFTEMYNRELLRFKSLLDQCVHVQQEVINAAYKAYTASIASGSSSSFTASSAIGVDDSITDNMNMEITYNDLASTQLSTSAPVTTETAIDEYKNDENNNNEEEPQNLNEAETQSQRKIATTNTWTTQPVHREGPEEDETKSTSSSSSSVSRTPIRKASRGGDRDSVSSVRTSRSSTRKSSRTNTGTAPVPQRMAVRDYVSYKYKYEGKGFEVWKRNGQRAIYQETKLHCTKTFGDNEAGKKKLKRYLVQRGGFNANCIEYVQVVKARATPRRDAYCFAVITVRDSLENIERAINRLNATSSNGDVMWMRYETQYLNERNANRRLFVTGFDILSANDHRRMTDLFLKYGQLAGDLMMNKDRNGNPFAVVTFREQRDAGSCVQDCHSLRTDAVQFNGRELHIRYYTEEKQRNGKNKNNGRRWNKSN
jgi:hypothetical protein